MDLLSACRKLEEKGFLEKCIQRVSEIIGTAAFNDVAKEVGELICTQPSGHEASRMAAPCVFGFVPPTAAVVWQVAQALRNAPQPILEIGGGNGIWKHVLSRHGVTMSSCDIYPAYKAYAFVETLEATEAVARRKPRSLFFMFPLLSVSRDDAESIATGTLPPCVEERAMKYKTYLGQLLQNVEHVTLVYSTHCYPRPAEIIPFGFTYSQSTLRGVHVGFTRRLGRLWLARLVRVRDADSRQPPIRA